MHHRRDTVCTYWYNAIVCIFISGVIRDNTGSYNAIFAIISTAQGIAAVLLIGDFVSRKLNRHPVKDISGKSTNICV
jgi:hypothetical protein